MSKQRKQKADKKADKKASRKVEAKAAKKAAARRHRRVPIEKVLPGMRLHPLDPDLTPEFAYVVIKSRDPDGEVTWAYRTTSRLDEHELLGMLEIQTAVHKQLMLEDWVDEE